jgi:Asp-tRNA(Asn)/Glu-tRNA(Gln) amidotransferase C subunit
VVFTDEEVARLVKLEVLEPQRENFSSNLGSVVGLVERVSLKIFD